MSKITTKARKCPDCSKFLQFGTWQKRARKPSGDPVLVGLSGYTCGCGYKELASYTETIARLGLQPYRAM